MCLLFRNILPKYRWMAFASLILMTTWLFASTEASAGEFTAQLNRQVIQVGEDVQLTLTIQGSYSGEPELPDVPGLNVLSTSTSQSVSIINGSMSKQVEFIYILVAEREGTFVIPSLSMKVDGEVLSSSELTLQVKQANSSVQDDASGEPPLLFIEREFSKSSVYVNEPFISTVKIYYRVELSEANPQLSEPPEFKAIALEQQNKYRSQVKGYDYHVVELNRIYIPLKAGTFELSPFKLNATMVVPGSRNPRSTDPFDFFGRGVRSGQQVRRMAQSASQSIEVKSVPQDGRPANYSGLVGQYSLEADLTPSALKVGETATLTVKLKGWGQLEGFQLKNPIEHQQLRSYDDKPELSTRHSAQEGIFSEATYKYALVPTGVLEQAFSQLELSVFNPQTQQFETLSAPLGSLKVTASAEELRALQQNRRAVKSGDEASQKQLEQVGHDIFDLKRDTKSLTRQQTLGFKQIAWTLAGLALPFMIWLFLVFKNSSLGSLFQSSSKREQRQAFSIMQAKFQASRKNTISSTSEKMQEIIGNFREFLKTKLQVPGGLLTARELPNLLSQRKINGEVVQRVTALFQKIEMLQYAQKDLSSEEFEQLAVDLEKAAKELDR